MGYNDDWESLMNSVFGPGGRMRTGGAPAAKDAKTGPKPAAKAGPKPAKPDRPAPDLNQALLEQQKHLDKLLKKQSEALRAQDASTKQALEDSRRLLRDMEDDGLLARGTADTPAEHLGSFEGLAAEVKQVVLGQDAYVDALVRAMRRPFVLGTEGQKARNVILLWGPAGTGRHFALEETARRMAARGLLQSDQTARMDLALYADPGAEKLFLQDLYAALHGPGEMVLFDHYESCCPAFLKTLADLAVKGAAPLASRYLVNREGILVDAGAALAAGAVSRITPRGKYLIFFSHKGRAEMAGLLGADFAAALGDACETKPFTRESLQALAARLLNELARRCARQLQLTLSAGEDVRDYVAARHTDKEGAAALAGCCERIFRALSEYCLRQDSFQPGTAALTVREGALCFSIDGSAPAPLADLRPAAWDGGVEAVRRELDALVGLDEVKQYVFGLADNVQVQKRRAAAGLKTASLSMHMIFTAASRTASASRPSTPWSRGWRITGTIWWSFWPATPGRCSSSLRPTAVWPAASPIRSSSPTTPPTSCWTSPSRWPPPAATVWTTAAPSPCWATTSAGRPPTAAPPATAVWPAIPSKRPSTTRAAVWWPSRTPPSI